MTSNIESRSDQSGFGLKLLDTAAVAQMLNVSESWVRDHANPHGPEPRLQAIKLGTGKTACVRFHPTDVLAFIDDQRQQAKMRGAGVSRWRH
jgi:hypothetical protein